MQIVSNEFISGMDRLPYTASITLDGIDGIQKEAIQTINFNGCANGDDSGVTMGCAVAASVEITLDKSKVDVDFIKRDMYIQLGMETSAGTEWLPMGHYTVTDVQENDGVMTVVGMDPIAEKFETAYENSDGFDFNSDAGISAKVFVTAMCQRHGVSVDLSDLTDIQLTGFDPTGVAERTLLGMVAGLYGKFAIIDRGGVLRFRWYARTDAKVTADNYYDDGLEKAGYLFRVGWLKCYNETLEETFTEGDPEAEQGIYFACPWMTYEILKTVWNDVKDFTYAPVAGLSFMGDPRLDPGDIITLEDLSGQTYSVPVMSISHEFDGGLRTEITAQGQVKSDAYEGPVQREMKRVLASIKKTQEGIESTVDNLQGDVSAIKQQAGQIVVEIKDEDGNILLTTKITKDEWSALRTENGVVTSGFYYDFKLGRFVYKGAGEYCSDDGTTYLRIEGNRLVLYSSKDTEEPVEKLAIGFLTGRDPDDIEDVDYPYILLGNSGTDVGQAGLIKKFWDGVFIGNSAAKDAYGRFNPAVDWAGFFINTVTGKSYVVQDGYMKDVYLDDPIARFA